MGLGQGKLALALYSFPFLLVVYAAKLARKPGEFCIRMVHLIRGTSKGFFGLDLNSLLLLLR